MSESRYERATELLEAELGDELVALDSQAGSCFGFNDVATIVWRQLEQPKSFDQLRDLLLMKYEVTAAQCTEELQELLDDLIEKGLVLARTDSTSHQANPAN
jgi:hypothetical protein